MLFGFDPSVVGVMFMSIVNLPHHQRMKQRWTMLLGIIPGPPEPKIDINIILTPLVNELETLWSGVEVMVPDGTKTSLRAALVCVASGILIGCSASFWGKRLVMDTTSAV